MKTAVDFAIAIVWTLGLSLTLLSLYEGVDMGKISMILMWFVWLELLRRT